MAKREFSSGLKAMKFMQRAKAREEHALKEEETDTAVVDEDHWVVPLAQTSGRCVVISEGDPRPGATTGRMSFKSYNLVVESLHEEIQARKERARSAAKSAKVETTKAEKPSTEEDAAKLSTSSNHSCRISINERRVKHEQDEEHAHARKKVKLETPAGKLKDSRSSGLRKPQAAKPVASRNRYDVLQSSRGFRKPPAL